MEKEENHSDRKIYERSLNGERFFSYSGDTDRNEERLNSHFLQESIAEARPRTERNVTAVYPDSCKATMNTTSTFSFVQKRTISQVAGRKQEERRKR
jgi:hypothetical protein